MTFPPAWLKRIGDALDRFQQRFKGTAVLVAIVKRNGDDRGGLYTALITFYGLVSIFPLLLIFVTVASRILGPDSQTTKNLIHSALSQIPVIGTHLESNIHALATGSLWALVVSILFLLWGSLGIASALQSASHEAWRVPRHREPNFWIRNGRGLLLLAVIGLAVVITTISAGFTTSGWLRQFSRFIAPSLIVAGIAINIGAYLIALKILAPRSTKWRQLITGAVLGALGWSALQHVGGYLLSHQLHRTTEIYGFFAIVLGLIFWLSLGARLFLYATETNVVLATHDWPRGLFEPSDAAKASMAAEEAARAQGFDVEN